MDNTYTETLKAALSREASQFVLGDALIEECGPPSTDNINNGSEARLKEAQSLLETNGVEYGLSTLREFRDIAYMFPVEPRTKKVNEPRRIEGLTYSVHVVFRKNPTVLMKWVKNTEKQEGEIKLTVAAAKEIFNKQMEIAEKNAQKGRDKAKAGEEAAGNDEAAGAKGETSEGETPETVTTTSSDAPAPQSEPTTTPPVVPHEEPDDNKEPDDEDEDETRPTQLLREAEDSLALWGDIADYLKDNKEHDQAWLRDLGKTVVKLKAQLNNLSQLAVLKPEIKAAADKSKAASGNGSGGEVVNFPMAASGSNT